MNICRCQELLISLFMSIFWFRQECRVLKFIQKGAQADYHRLPSFSFKQQSPINLAERLGLELQQLQCQTCYDIRCQPIANNHVSGPLKVAARWSWIVECTHCAFRVRLCCESNETVLQTSSPQSSWGRVPFFVGKIGKWSWTVPGLLLAASEKLANC